MGRCWFTTSKRGQEYLLCALGKLSFKQAPLFLQRAECLVNVFYYYGYSRSLWLFVFVVALVAMFSVDNLFSHGDLDPGDIHLGQWVAANNSEQRIEFWYVETEPSTMLIKAFEGRVRIAQLFGHENIEGTWGFETLHPLRLSISLPEEQGHLVFRRVTDDWLQVRYSTSPEDTYAGDPFTEAETVDLYRVGEGRRLAAPAVN